VFAPLRAARDAKARSVAGGVAACSARHRRPGVDRIAAVLAGRPDRSRFRGETRALAIVLVRIFFPGISSGPLAFARVLNSHHRFFLSLPRRWSGARRSSWRSSSEAHAGRRRSGGPHRHLGGVGRRAGGALQLLVQLPQVLRLLERVSGFARTGRPARQGGGPQLPSVVAGRGVVQLSAYVDMLIASFMPSGTVAAFGYAQTIYLLPVSLFGMSVSAAALPSMSAEAESARQAARADGGRPARHRISGGPHRRRVPAARRRDLRRALPDRQLQRRRHAKRLVFLIGSTVGLLAATMGRLYSSAFYALRDTRTPLRYATIRVLLTAGLGSSGRCTCRASCICPRAPALWVSPVARNRRWDRICALAPSPCGAHRGLPFAKGLLPRLWASAAAAVAWPGGEDGAACGAPHLAGNRRAGSLRGHVPGLRARPGCERGQAGAGARPAASWGAEFQPPFSVFSLAGPAARSARI